MGRTRYCVGKRAIGAGLRRKNEARQSGPHVVPALLFDFYRHLAEEFLGLGEHSGDDHSLLRV